jgi:hypothetical protein
LDVGATPRFISSRTWAKVSVPSSQRPYRSKFKNIFHNTNLPNLLNHQNYDELGKLLSMFFEYIYTILK